MAGVATTECLVADGMFLAAGEKPLAVRGQVHGSKVTRSQSLSNPESTGAGPTRAIFLELRRACGVHDGEAEFRSTGPTVKAAVTAASRFARP